MKNPLLRLSIGLFLLIPLYGYAAEDAAASSTSTQGETVGMSTSTASTTPVRPFTACSQAAIEKRDTKIASTRLTYNNVMSSALTERKNREKAAIAIDDASDQKDALKASIETYKNQVKVAQNTLSQARKTAWQTFDTDIKKCRDLEADMLSQDTETKDQAATQTAQMGMMKKTGSESTQPQKEDSEIKSIKDTFKAQLESLRSLFN